MKSVTPKKIITVGLHFSKLGCCKPITFPKELHHKFFWSLAMFLRIDLKNNSW